MIPLSNQIFNLPYGQSLLPQRPRQFSQHQLHPMGHVPDAEQGRILFPVHR